MFTTTARRNTQLALVAVLVTAACAEAVPRALVTIRVEEESYRPEYLVMTWEAPQGPPPQDVRVPAHGELPRTGAELATVWIELDEARPGDRQVRVRGIRGGHPISGAMARVPWQPGRPVEVTLTLGPLSAVDTLGGADGGSDDGPATPTSPPDGAPGAAPDLPAIDLLPADAGAGGPTDAGAAADREVPPPPDAGGAPDAAAPVPDAAPDPDAGPPDATPDGPADLAPPLPPGVDLNEGLVLYLKLDDVPANGALRDSSGNANQAVLTNLDVQQARVPGHPGHAIALPGGAMPGWISVKGSPSLDRIAGELSVSVWVRPSTDPAGGSGTILSRAASAGGALYSLHLVGLRPLVRLNSSQASPGVAPGVATVAADRWVHVAFVYDQEHLFIYLDGRPAGAGAHRLGFPPEITPLLIGGTQGYGNTVVDPFAGQLDEIAIYARALSVPEVKALAAGFHPQPR